MTSSGLFPDGVERHEVGDVERQQCSALGGGVDELIVVRDALISSAGVLAALHVQPMTPQRLRQSRVDVLVGEETDRHLCVGVGCAVRATDSLRAMSSSTRCGCCA